MNKLTRILILMLALVIAISLVSCGKDGTDGTGDGDGTDTGTDGEINTPPATETDPEELILIENNVAKFRVVTTSETAGATIKAVNSFVENLRIIGVEIDDPVRDSAQDSVVDCEIIIGTNARNRDEKYVLDPHDYGDEGYIIKIVDNKVLIGGGNLSQTSDAFEYFVKNIVKLTTKTKELSDLRIKRDYQRLKETKYLIDSIEIAGSPLSDFVFVTNVDDNAPFDYSAINGFRNKLYEASGYWLTSVKADGVPEGQKRLAVLSVDDAGKDGFRAYVDSEGSFIIECAYNNAFNIAFDTLMKSLIFDKIGAVTVSKSFEKTYPVSVVKYSQFGAVGDGKTNDFAAIYNTHVFANQCGQKVLGDAGMKYFIHDVSDTIPVKTDVDWCGATFHVDDRGSNVYKKASLGLFTLLPSHETKCYGAEELQQMSGGAPIKEGAEEIPWLVPYLEADSFIYLYNNHRDYIRHGGNVSSGMLRRDVFVIGKDGKVDPDTYIWWDFEAGTQLINNGLKLEAVSTPNIAYMEIYRLDETPITVENAYFERDVCDTVAETGYENKYIAYNRGIRINRSGATVKNLHHELTYEPYLDTYGYGYYDDAHTSIRQSYPYSGFLAFTRCYNSRAIDCDLHGRTTYYEIKTTNPEPVPMGSYDLTIGDASNISLYGLTNGVDICDSQYWGIMASYGAKNMHFEDCSLSRFDAHDGFWNANLIDCEFGRYINVVGGGYLYIKDTERKSGQAYIDLRSDYGSSFRGDITVINGTIEGQKSYRGPNDEQRLYNYETLYLIRTSYQDKYQGAYEEGNAGAAPFLKWDFGYTCYMPQNVVIDNFSVMTEATVYLYQSVGDNAFIKPKDFVQDSDWKGKSIVLPDGTTRPMTEDDIYYNQYQITKSVVYKNMLPLPPCEDNSLHLYKHLSSVTRVE